MKFLVLGLFISLFMIIYLIMYFIVEKKLIEGKRINELKNYGENINFDVEEEKRMAYKNLLKKYADYVIKFFSIGFLKIFRNILIKKFQMAGIYNKENIYKKIVQMMTFVFISSLLIVFILEKINNYSLFESIKIYMVVFILLLAIQYLKLISRIKSRRKEISKSLPDIIDTISVSVEAGLSFDASINRMIKSVDTVLVQEFAFALKQMRLGMERKKALKELSKRCSVEELSTFISAINQSEELGVSISNILKIQSQDIRQKRYEKIREKSMKAPFKLLFPIVLFIFPSIFYILLGPAIIRLIEFF